MSPRSEEQNKKMREKTLKKINEAALRIFTEYGYHGASINQILKESGLSKGVLYHYFPSKAEIFLHLNRISFRKSNEIMEKAVNTDGTAWEKIEILASLLVKEVLNEEFVPYFHITLLAMTEGKGIPGIQKLMTELTGETSYYANFYHLIKEAQESGDAVEGDPDLLSAAFAALVQGMAFMIFRERELGDKITPDILTNLLQKKK